jgi:uncharacterized protein
MAGLPLGYFLGFLFTWVVWCLLVPIVLAGTAGVRAMFRAPDPSVRPMGRIDWLILALPLLVAYGYAFPHLWSLATPAVVVRSALIALVNGTLEEILWRGTYVRQFPRQPFWGWIYPSIGFALWHLAPLSVTSGASTPGGTAAFVAVAGLFGLGWGWVAFRTGSIRWPVVSHVLLDFAGLGALIYIG